MINEEPRLGDKLYFCFMYEDGEWEISYVEIIRVWTDTEAYVIPRKVCTGRVIKNTPKHAVGQKEIIDNFWHLQKSEEDCKKLLFMSLLKYGMKAFWKDVPPWQ